MRFVRGCVAIAATVLVCGGAGAEERPKVVSTVHTIAVRPGTAAEPQTVYAKQAFIESPVWTRDGKSLIFDRDFHIVRVAATGGEPAPVETGAGTNCGGSHGISHDGTTLAITCDMPGKTGARIYVVPVGGGTPREVTATGGSYFHGWSPDGKTILFTRGGHGVGDIFAINVDGTNERKLTTSAYVDDDPDYQPDGQWIWFNSDRTGVQQIWRMRPDGSGAEQMTNGDRPSWTPHPSPDGKTVLILSYKPGVKGHLSNQEIELGLLSTADKRVTRLVTLTGGAGTDNTNGWSADSSRVAYVSYELVGPGNAAK